jgi:hypothetical protein
MRSRPRKIAYANTVIRVPELACNHQNSCNKIILHMKKKWLLKKIGRREVGQRTKKKWAPEPISRVKGKEEYLDPAKSQIRISRSATLCPVTITTELRPTSRIRSTCPDNLARLHVHSGRMSMPF